MTRLAFVSPFPPQRSGIADYAAGLLPGLARQFEITLVSEVPPQLPGPAHAWVDARRGGWRRALDACDVALYQMGNHPLHGFVFDALSEYPGVVTLHEVLLHASLAGRWLPADPERYVAEMRYAHGPDGERAARQAIDKALAIWDYEPWRYPLTRRVVDNARGLVLHSRFALDRVREIRRDAPIFVLPFPMPPPGKTREEARLSLGVGTEEFRIVVPGFLTRSKRLAGIFGAVTSWGNRPGWSLVLLGEVGDPTAAEGCPEGIRERVVFTGYAEAGEFARQLAAADVAIVLRWPTSGETSGVACQALGAGVPLIVTDTGWFSELPDEVVLRVLPGQEEEDEIAAALQRLRDDPAERARRASAAAAYARKIGGFDCAAQRYAALLAAVAKGRGLDLSVASSVAAALGDIGLGEGDDDAIDRIVNRAADLAPSLGSGIERK
jgi:glycosyltransferase involved in cell wall biosynthesis